MKFARNAMIIRLLAVCAIVASADAARLSPTQVGAARTGGARADAPPAKCKLTAERSPALYGFRLGMTAAEVTGRFPDFPDLARFESASQMIEWRDAAGVRAISGGGKGDSGLSALTLHGSYLGPRVPHAERAGEFSALGLLFLDGRLVRILLGDWRSPHWKEVEGFKQWVGPRYGLTGLGWRVFRREVKLPPGVPPDFLSDTHAIDCDGFTVEVSCVGPPGPLDFCDLSFRDTAADAVIEARSRAIRRTDHK